jgi:hypothetical protein
VHRRLLTFLGAQPGFEDQKTWRESTIQPNLVQPELVQILSGGLKTFDSSQQPQLERISKVQLTGQIQSIHG